ncbi:hypothetical protein Pla110_44330 [Polystyrenella longa]|uniref:DUF2190 domain-containing protein n=1 Tax=Polystyrenella longa TaxID=2528007 RepID=A0A518CTX4_9PLAN|nr:capsid cement protein [Polystyrenella longa]QDU82672.1 hypothetical protein Pla110_44330 [Polystyrenella longa]
MTVSGNNNGNLQTFTAGGAIPKHARVKLSSGKLAVAGIADRDIGFAEVEAFADGDKIAVRLRSASGIQNAIAAEALAEGADVYTAASGKVADTAASTAFLRGTALAPATADGDIIPILPYSPVGEANS